MLHACIERFDVMGGRENILGWDGEVNKATVPLLLLHAAAVKVGRVHAFMRARASFSPKWRTEPGRH
jgi:hypothetical protein